MPDVVNAQIEISKYVLKAGEKVNEGLLQPFDPDELLLWDGRWQHMMKLVNLETCPPVVTKVHEGVCLESGALFKGKKKKQFTGTGENGFGAREIIPEDVHLNTSCVVWDLGNPYLGGVGVVPEPNWVVGAVGSRFSRGDWGALQRNVGTFFAQTSAVTRDVGNDQWAVCWFGEMDQLAQGDLDGTFIALNERESSFEPIEYTQRNSQMGWTDYGKGYHIDEDSPYKTGKQVKPETAVPGAAIAAVVSSRPVGVSWVTQRRSLTQGIITRPTV